MQRIKKNELYFLQAKLVVFEVKSVATTDNTLLWHTRLGRIDENGLKELSNQQGVLDGDNIGTLGFCDQRVL